MGRGTGDLSAGAPRREQVVPYAELPNAGDETLEFFLTDSGYDLRHCRFRRVTIELEELEELVSLPEDYLLDGDEEGYELTLDLADSYHKGHPVPGVVLRGGESGWSVLDGYHRINGASFAGETSIDAYVLVESAESTGR